MISNGEGGTISMEMGDRYAGKTFIDLLKKNDAEIILNEEGRGDFYAPAGSVSVWVEK